MAEQKHKHGDMDITEQEQTFRGFMRWSVNIAVACIVIVIVLAIFAR
ncbi:MAG: aa3-type cytochrome c oxidase subunit IV [Rhodobacteraceae bacterium]|nr:aa3-type cytochrome c oxidase subunit IV [Paracoccaceae bacterium]